VPLGLAGLIAGAPAEHNRLYWVWLSFLPWYAVGLAAFFIAERYRLPMFVPLSIGAGAALAQFPRWTPRARMVAAGAGLAGAVITAWPFAVPDGRFEERLRLSKVLMNRGDYFGATAELQSAFALRPDDTVTEFNLGMALATAGQAEAGIAHVRRAVEAGVPVDGARYALANLLLRTGDSDGAVRLLRTYSPLPTDSAESCYHVGVLALEARAPAVADRFLRRALELRPGWPEAEQALAEAAAAQFGPRR
jgi:tetratricopeptide (TPR) repeat protein